MKCRHGPSLEPVKREPGGNVWACSRCGRRFRWGPSRSCETIPECRSCGRQIVTQVLCGACPEDFHRPEPEPAGVLRIEGSVVRREREAFPRTAAVELARLSAAVLGARYRWANERELQDGLHEVLAAHLRASPGAVDLTREARLGGRDRIDFLVGTLGVEVKVDGSLAQVTRQLARYALVEDLEGLLLVTTQAAHLAVPRELAGKPVVVARLIGGIS